MTNKQPVPQICSQPTVLLNNLQNFQNQTSSRFPLSSMPLGANVPIFVNAQTQSNAKQNQFWHPKNWPSKLNYNKLQANASNANLNPVPQLTKDDYKHSIESPPLELQNYNGDPLQFHEWINSFYRLIQQNTAIKDKHQLTYLQVFVPGKAKDTIHAYFCDPSCYETALSELINQFGDPTIMINAFINLLEKWQVINQNKQCYIAFSSSLKKLVQAFQCLVFMAGLQSTTLLVKAKEKVPHNLILKWTEHCLTEFHSDQPLAELQQWLQLQAQVYDKVNRDCVEFIVKNKLF